MTRTVLYVDDQPENRRLGKEVGQQPAAFVAAHIDEGLKRAADTVPAGQEMTVLGPGEDPGDGAQVGRSAARGASRS